MITKAFEIAKKYHSGQKYDGKSYVDGHLKKVFQIGKKFTNDEKLLVACILHDTLEDTKYTALKLKKDFGDDILKWVEAVTDGKGKTREEKKVESYKKMMKSKQGRFVKLCDRIANMQASFNKPKFRRTYLAESNQFVEKLRRPNEHSELWGLYNDTVAKLTAKEKNLIDQEVAVGSKVSCWIVSSSDLDVVPVEAEYTESTKWKYTEITENEARIKCKITSGDGRGVLRPYNPTLGNGCGAYWGDGPKFKSKNSALKEQKRAMKLELDKEIQVLQIKLAEYEKRLNQARVTRQDLTKSC